MSPRKHRRESRLRFQGEEIQGDEEDDYEDGVSTDAYGFSSPESEQRKRRHGRLRSHRSAVGSLNRRVRYDTNVSGFAAIQSDDLQVKYQVIRESVVRHRLPKDLKFSGSMKGIKAQSKDMVKNLISSGKYIETALKVTSNIQASKDIAGYDPYHDIDDLLICLITHMRVIQEEYCMLAIGGSYGPRTQQIFRTIHNNPSQFTPNVIEELKCSATLAALPQKQGQQTTGFKRENTFGRPFQ